MRHANTPSAAKSLELERRTYNANMTQIHAVAAETLKKWGGGRAPRAAIRGGGLPPPHLWESGVLQYSGKICENTGANICNIVYFGAKIRILNNSVFNSDSERPI